MKRLPDKAEAEKILRQTGYVRVGDHSATTFEALDEIYATRNAAWRKAEEAGIGIQPPKPAEKPEK